MLVLLWPKILDKPLLSTRHLLIFCSWNVVISLILFLTNSLSLVPGNYQKTLIYSVDLTKNVDTFIEFTFIILLILYIAKWQIVWTALQFRLITFSVLFNLGFNKTILKCLHFDALIERIYQADS